MKNFTKVDALKYRQKVMLLEHREDQDELLKMLQSKFTPIIMTRRVQKDIIENFHKLKFSLKMTHASKLLKKPVSSIHDAYKELCKSNKVELIFVINDCVVAKIKTSYSKC